MQPKTAGILGGLGPETTAHFYLEIVALCQQKKIPNRPPLLMWNIPLPYDLEKEFITTGKRIDEYLPFLIEGAKRLEKGGADFIAIPCNSVHILIDEIRKFVQIPILSIIEETAIFLEVENVKKTGVLATTPTVKSRMYDGALQSSGITTFFPETDDQNTLSDLIQQLVQNKDTKESESILPVIMDKFTKQGISTIILACTDLQLIVKDYPAMKIYDTMKILAKATVKNIC